MKLELAYNIFEILQTMVEAVKMMLIYQKNGNNRGFNQLSTDLSESLFDIQQISKREFAEDKRIRLADACVCAMDSLKEIKLLIFTDLEKASWKIECELLTIVETMMLQFFYWGIVKKNLQKLIDYTVC